MTEEYNSDVQFSAVTEVLQVVEGVKGVIPGAPAGQGPVPAAHVTGAREPRVGTASKLQAVDVRGTQLKLQAVEARGAGGERPGRKRRHIQGVQRYVVGEVICFLRAVLLQRYAEPGPGFKIKFIFLKKKNRGEVDVEKEDPLVRVRVRSDQSTEQGAAVLAHGHCSQRVRRQRSRSHSQLVLVTVKAAASDFSKQLGFETFWHALYTDFVD